MLLKNKNAVVTGCNRGIGKKILKIFSDNGANVLRAQEISMMILRHTAKILKLKIKQK